MMNDKRIKHIVLPAIAVLLTFVVPSCVQEEPVVSPLPSDDDNSIIFFTSLPGVEARSYDNIEAGHLAGGFSVTAMNLDDLINENASLLLKPNYLTQYNKIDLYFKDKLVERTEGMGNAFRGDFCKWPEEKDGKDGLLQFFAFYPSVDTLKSKLVLTPGDKTAYFLVQHPVGTDQSEKRDTGYWFNYRMGNYLINKDISKHFDFVAASTRGSKKNNLYSGIELKFQHKLCRVDLKAWGNPAGYDIEIAGVRFGNVITMSTYNLAGNWISHAATWDDVEYIFTNGDVPVTIGKGNHDKAANAVSIMGKGGYAMIIPHQPSNLALSLPNKWDYQNNPSNIASNNKSKGMFFSVLLRVIDRSDDNQGLILYPYNDGATINGTATASNKNSVYLVVDKDTDTVKGRVYKNKTTKQYFSDEALKNSFSLPEGQEIREYGWAAIPCRAQWKIGNAYTYTLDYTEGVGLHAPDDDAPGKTIITPFAVGLSEEGSDWKMVKEYDKVTWEDGDEKDFKYKQE